MTQRTASRLLTAFTAAALAGGLMTALSWGPLPAGELLTSPADAHYDDMAPLTSQRPGPSALAASGQVEQGTQAGQAPVPVPVRTPAREREPAHLSIPELGIEADVLRTWMDGTGSLIVPEDVLVTGWFDGSRRLDAPYGSTVIVGHRDSAVQGTGALYAIEELPPGTSITVTDQSGVPHDFVVESVELVDKEVLPQEAPRIFTHRGPHRLVLITCGGTFDEAARSYLSNVIVTALPASADSD